MNDSLKEWGQMALQKDDVQMTNKCMKKMLSIVSHQRNAK